MANIITAPESGIYFDGNTAGVSNIPTLTGDASGVAIQYDGYAGLKIASSATGANYQDRFSVEGANGRLFGVSDAVTGTVFSVNDAAGLPIIEVESTSDYDKITIGEYGTDALVISGSSVQVTGATVATQAWVTSQSYVTASSEQQTLDNVLGQGNTSSNSMSVGAITGSALTIDTDTLYVDATNNRVGIGTTSPDSILHIQDGTTDSTATTVRIGGSSNHTSRIELAESVYNNAMSYGYSITTDGASTNDLIIRNHENSSTGSTAIAIQRSDGHISLGTDPRGDRLTVNGDIGIFGNKIYNGESNNSAGLGFDGSRANLYGYNGIRFYSSTAAISSQTERMRIDSSGNVGIGVTSPQGQLHINGGDLDTRAYNAENPTNSIYLNPTNGDTLGTSNTVGGGLIWKTYYVNYTKKSAGILAIGEGNYFRTGLAFYTNNSASHTGDWSERMRIDMDGNVGIGTTSPNYELHVIGTASFTDTVAGAYFEENASHPSLKKLDTGTILVMNEEGQLVPCSKADDTMVFGVSKHGYKQPIVMGAEPIKVTGPIKVGDFITTSDVPGHGKKSNQPYPFGTIIAQAMESGDGESYHIKAMIRKM